MIRTQFFFLLIVFSTVVLCLKFSIVNIFKKREKEKAPPGDSYAFESSLWVVLGQMDHEEAEINSIFQKPSNSQIYLTLGVFRERSRTKEAAEGISALFWKLSNVSTGQQHVHSNAFPSPLLGILMSKEHQGYQVPATCPHSTQL